MLFRSLELQTEAGGRKEAPRSPYPEDTPPGLSVNSWFSPSFPHPRPDSLGGTLQVPKAKAAGTTSHTSKLTGSPRLGAEHP